MSWIRRLFGRNTNTSSVHCGTFEVIEGKLLVKVYAHQVDNSPKTIDCWTYVSDGFAAVGNSEILLTIARGSEVNIAEPPHAAFYLFRQIWGLTSQGAKVNPGDTTIVAPRDNFLGLTGTIGFTYTPGRWPGIFDLPIGQTETLQAHLLVPGEPEFVYRYGQYRLLSRLGKDNFHFPYPSWSAPDRESVITEADVNGSILTQFPCLRINARLRMPISTMTTSAGAGEIDDIGSVAAQVALRIHRSALPTIRNAVDQLTGEAWGFILLADPDPDAGAHLTWRPGDTGHDAVTLSSAQVNSITGNFFAVFFSADIEANGFIMEDGFAVTVDATRWAPLREALTQGTPAHLAPAGPGNLGFSVEVVDEFTA